MTTALSYASGTSTVPLIGRTIGDDLARTVKRFGDREALVWRTERGALRWSYRDLQDRSMEVARALVACGLGKGGRAGILMTNRPEHVAAAFGTALAGGVIVELNCETDFVAKGAPFQEALAKLTALVISEGDDDLANKTIEGSTVDDFVKGLSGTLGEKMELGRVYRFEAADGLLDGYKHVQNERGTVGVVVEMAGVEVAQAIQLGLEYDPQPPVDAGSPSKASPEIKALVEATNG